MKQKGFSGIFIVIILAVTSVISAGSFYILNRDAPEPVGSNYAVPAPATPQMENISEMVTPKKQTTVTNNAKLPSKTYWQLTGTGWEPVGIPPQCPEPFSIVPPTDVSLVTSVLYPGQIRNGNTYEPGGGFRFDTSPNDVITVRVPEDATVTGGARFLVQGEIQYVFDLIVPCGILFRYDHLLLLSPEFKKIANTFPAPKENDTRTTFLNSPIPVAANDIVATAVGLRNNSFISWSVFDLRQKNSLAQKNPFWAAEHPTLEHYAVCPYDFLSSDIQKIIYSLPAADSTSGNKSDFCN